MEEIIMIQITITWMAFFSIIALIAALSFILAFMYWSIEKNFSIK